MELLDDEDCVDACFMAQIKHFCHLAYKNGTDYDIQSNIIAYAQRIKGKVVILIKCDTEKNAFYW